MGFPKPWPTEWPEPADFPERPIDPSIFPGITQPAPPEDYGDEDMIDELPEYRRRFYAVTWAVNHACNLKCAHCYDVVNFKRKDLSTSDALRLIDQLAEAGVTFIAFSGGEAFLRKDIFQLMERAKQRGIGFGARSNGTRITPFTAQVLRELDIAVVGISFDGATPASHDAVRGPGAFVQSIAGLQALRAEGIRTQMEVVLSKQNMHEALDFIKLGESIGASEVNFSTMAVQGRAKQRHTDVLDHATWWQLTNILRNASKQARIPVTPNCALVGACVANIEPHITCDGWMSPCYLSTEKLFQVLETPAQAIRELLMQSRQSVQNICGREAWIRPSKVG